VSKDLITPIMRVQIELAIANARHDPHAVRLLEEEAKHLALSGAEIDAAKRGGSFDLLVDIAVNAHWRSKPVTTRQAWSRVGN